ncbi:cupin domain-containing protein [Nesterenkonia ebinurensis]|uniref:hypothetical protein n=1 Tax=Nesterenkonia ebinurensis TaxID=2608252 RepID=UPI00123D1C78|nr:hypothetical protein [Nesterenkonia ebinurensis]
MYPKDDPRSVLEKVAPTPSDVGALGAAATVEVDNQPPAIEHEGGARTWTTSGDGFRAAYSRLNAGQKIRAGDSDEPYLLYVSSGEVAIENEHQSENLRAVVQEPSVLLVREGALTIRAESASALVWALPRDSNVLENPLQLSRYDETESHSVAVYSLSDVEEDPSRFGRIFSSGAVMMNVLPMTYSERDTTVLSPHSHNFAQCTVTIEGRFIHDLRVPWGADMMQWVEDEHRKCNSPSLTVIHPGIIHTLRWGDGRSHFVDIFGPPRDDFIEQGWVLNLDDI